jgi:hypothetical protein
MTKRVVGVSLFGIGVCLVLVALGLSLVVAPVMSQLPYDLDSTVITTEASNATFVQVKMVGQTPSIQVEHADLRARTSVQPDYAATSGLTGDIAGRTVVWHVYQKAERADTGEAIDASETDRAGPDLRRGGRLERSVRG